MNLNQVHIRYFQKLLIHKGPLFLQGTIGRVGMFPWSQFSLWFFEFFSEVQDSISFSVFFPTKSLEKSLCYSKQNLGLSTRCKETKKKSNKLLNFHPCGIDPQEKLWFIQCWLAKWTIWGIFFLGAISTSCKKITSDVCFWNSIFKFSNKF
jgi:hypothetical protein